MRLALAVIVSCAGCDQLFNLDHLRDVPIDARGDGGGSGSDGGSIDAMVDAARPIQFVQGTFYNGTTDISVFKVWPAPQQAGDLNVVFIGWTTQGSAVTSIGDSRNTYDVGAAANFINGIGEVAYYAENIAGGSSSINIIFNQQTANVDIRMLEYSGLATASALETNVTTAAVGTLMTTGVLTTTKPHSLIVAGFTVSGRTTTVGNACTERILTMAGNYAEDYEQFVAAPAELTATQDQSGAYIAQALAFSAP